MKSVALLVAGVATLLIVPASGTSQQTSVAYSRPIGIHQLSTPSHAPKTLTDGAEPGTAHKAPYVIIGSLLGGAAAGGWLAYEIAHGGGECICNPIPILAYVLGGGLIVGGVLGLITYYVLHPD